MDLGGSRWVQNTPIGCGNHLPTSRIILEKCMFSEICLANKMLCGPNTISVKAIIVVHI